MFHAFVEIFGKGKQKSDNLEIIAFLVLFIQ